MPIDQAVQELNTIIGVDSGIPVVITIYGFTYKVIGADVQLLSIGRLTLEYRETSNVQYQMLVSEQQINELLRMHAFDVREKRWKERLQEERKKKFENE